MGAFELNQPDLAMAKTDYSDASPWELLEGLESAGPNKLEVPNSSWMRRHFQLKGDHYVLAKGFGYRANFGWVPYETFKEMERDPDSSVSKSDISDEVNKPE